MSTISGNAIAFQLFYLHHHHHNNCIVFPPPPPNLPSFLFNFHQHHISITFPSPPPPPSHFYYSPSTTTIIPSLFLFNFHHPTLPNLYSFPSTTNHQISTVFPPAPPPTLFCSTSPPPPPQLTTPENTITYHNALCLSPQILHKHCFQFLLGPFQLPRETEGNA